MTSRELMAVVYTTMRQLTPPVDKQNTEELVADIRGVLAEDSEEGQNARRFVALLATKLDLAT